METQTTQANPQDPKNELHLFKLRAEYSRQQLIEACQSAVQCLERFAANARGHVERAAELDPAQLVDLPSRVLSECVWGSANASSAPSTATQSLVAYTTALREIQARKEAVR